MNAPEFQATTRTSLLVFAILATPFFLNDLVFIPLDRSPAIYIADYATRIFIIALALTPFARRLAFATDEPRGGIAMAVALLLLATLFALLISNRIEVIVWRFTGVAPMFGFPNLELNLLRWLDLSLGLLLVAFSEELVFRRVAARALKAVGSGTIVILTISSLAFGLIHWGKGPGSVVATTLTGAALMTLYLKTGRLWPPVVAHWAINFVSFAV